MTPTLIGICLMLATLVAVPVVFVSLWLVYTMDD